MTSAQMRRLLSFLWLATIVLFIVGMVLIVRDQQRDGGVAMIVTTLPVTTLATIAYVVRSRRAQV